MLTKEKPQHRINLNQRCKRGRFVQSKPFERTNQFEVSRFQRGRQRLWIKRWGFLPSQNYMSTERKVGVWKTEI